MVASGNCADCVENCAELRGTWKKVILNIMWSSIDVCEWWRSRFAASGHVVAKRITLPTMIGSTSASESSVE